MFLRLSSNAAFVGAGEAVGALFSLATMALIARTLGPNGFGQLALVLALATSLDLLFTFQSSRVFVRYGAQADLGQKFDDLALILKFCRVLDIVGVAAAALVVIAIAPIASRVIGLENAAPIYLYAIVILTNVTGHAFGVLRFFGQFRFIGAQSSIAGLARLLAVGCSVWLGIDSLIGMVAALVVADVFARVLLVAGAAQESSRRGLERKVGKRIWYITQICPDVISFSLLSNLSDAILKVVQQLDVFVVAGFLSTAEAGFYRLMKIIGSVLTMAAGAVGQVIYPEIARLHSGGQGLKDFLSRLWKILSLLSVIGLIGYGVVGGYAIDLVFGPEYRPVYVPSLIFMVGAAMSLLLVPVTPLFLVQGRQRALLLAYAAASLSYLGILALGAENYGLIGAALAFPVLYLVYGLLTFGFFGLHREDDAP